MPGADRGDIRDARTVAGVKFREEGLLFACAGDELVGVLTTPESPASVGVLIIVGGPQYRVGSHRQFVLVARALARAGYAALRFDYRGMGDASGVPRTFEDVNQDIGAALGEFALRCPAIERFVLWGLCDAASAALLYVQATGDARIAGVVLLNPWVRSEQSLAQAQVKHYYTERLADPQFWGKLLRGRLPVFAALRSFAANLATAFRRGKGAVSVPGRVPAFQERMAAGLDSFAGPVLLILSERDLTAKEFVEFVQSDRLWAEVVARPNVRRVELAETDHTFSSAAWRGNVEATTSRWLIENFAQREAAA